MKRTLYLFLLPTVAALLLVEGYPAIYSLYLSVTQFPEPAFVGADNYIQMATDPVFWESLRVTLLYVSSSVTLAFIIGLAFALFLFHEKRQNRILHTILILPIAVSPLIAGLLWSPSAIWDDINVFLKFVLGLPTIIMTNPNFAMTLMIISESWLWAPLFMLVFLSVLQSIPKEILEAAEVHGASTFQIFGRITFPLIIRSPVVVIIVAIKTIDTLRSFEIPFTWIGWIGQEKLGSPIDTLSVIMYKMMIFPIYEFPISYVATISLTLLVISLIVTAVILRVGRILWETT